MTDPTPGGERPRGALRQFGHDALGDLADELRYAAVLVLFVGGGAAVGYVVAQGEGAVYGGLAGAALLALVVVVVLVRWLWRLLTRGRRGGPTP